MDVPLEDGMLSPSAADMRPGERSISSFPSGVFCIPTLSYSVREPFPRHPTCDFRDKSEGRERGKKKKCVRRVVGSIWLISGLM